LRPMPTIPPHARTVWLWGPAAVHGMALRSAARAVAAGRAVALIDGAMAFHTRPLVAMAKACRIVPEAFLRQIHLVRAFTCWQFTTLLCEHLEPLLAAQPIGLILLLDPLTHFYDQDVTFKEATLLFQRVLQALSAPPPRWPPVLMAQVVPAMRTRRAFARDLLRVVDVGLRLLTGAGRWSVEVPSCANLWRWCGDLAEFRVGSKQRWRDGHQRAAEAGAQLQGIQHRLAAEVVVGDEIGLPGAAADDVGNLPKGFELLAGIAIVVALRGVPSLRKPRGGIAAVQPQIPYRTGRMIREPDRVRHLRLIDVTEAYAQLL
jgi:hypothetical protein